MGTKTKTEHAATLSNTKIKEKAKAVTVKAEITALMDPSRFEWDSIHQSLGDFGGTTSSG